MSQSPDDRDATSDRDNGRRTSRHNESGLPPPVLASMERAFGADLADVRVHRSSAEAASLGLRAFARGPDIHFAPGSWNPSSSHGLELIGHELAHVVQQAQRRAGDAHSQRSPDDDALEAEADHWGSLAARGEAVTSSYVSARSLAPNIMQSKIGFEMQSTWQIVRIGDNQRPASKAVAYKGYYFNIEVDRGIDTRPELEIVTHALANRSQLDAAMREIRYVIDILSSQRRQRFTIGPGDGWVAEVEIQRKSDPPPTFRLQYTEGVKIEDIPSLIKQLHPDAWNDLPPELSQHLDEEYEPSSTSEQSHKRESNDQVAGDAAGDRHRKRERPSESEDSKRSRLRGFEAAICMYLSDTSVWKPEQAGDTHKYAHTLMTRTDFYSMFQSLDNRDKQDFKGKIGRMSDKFYKFKLDGKVYPKLADNDPASRLTIRQWLQSMINGRSRGRETKDLMSPPPGFDSHAAVDAHNQNPRNQRQMKYAMGMYGIVGGRALFEARAVGSPHGQDLAGSQEVLENILDETASRDPRFARRMQPSKRQRNAGTSVSDDGDFDPLADVPEGAQDKFMPTPPQIARLKVHRRSLTWTPPPPPETGPTYLIFPLSQAWDMEPNPITDRVLQIYEELLGLPRDHLPLDIPIHILQSTARSFKRSVTVIDSAGSPHHINGGGPILIYVRTVEGDALFHATETV